MRIHFERTGGLMGRRLSATVDTDTLPPEQAHTLNEKVVAANFFALPPRFPESGRAADQFRYCVTVEEGPHRHTVETSELAASGPLRDLLEQLTALARKRR